MNTQHMDDLNRKSDKLLKAKIDKDTSVSPEDTNAMMCEVCHVMNLPTILDIYKEIGFEILKYAIGIGYFLVLWCLLSNVLDMIF